MYENSYVIQTLHYILADLTSIHTWYKCKDTVMISSILDYS